MIITDKMRICSDRNVKTVNAGRKDELSVLPKRFSYLFPGGFKKCHSTVA